jgi:hypothetical protein
VAGWRFGSAGRVSNRGLAAGLADLDRGIAAAETGIDAGNKQLAGRLDGLQRASGEPATTSGRRRTGGRAVSGQPQVAGAAPAVER